MLQFSDGLYRLKIVLQYFVPFITIMIKVTIKIIYCPHVTAVKSSDIKTLLPVTVYESTTNLVLINKKVRLLDLGQNKLNIILLTLIWEYRVSLCLLDYP